jgi:hypothetical protein
MFWWRKHFRDAMTACCRVTHIATHKRLSPDRIVATGFMPGTSVLCDRGINPLATDRIGARRTLLHLQFGHGRDSFPTFWR